MADRETPIAEHVRESEASLSAVGDIAIAPRESSPEKCCSLPETTSADTPVVDATPVARTTTSPLEQSVTQSSYADIASQRIISPDLFDDEPEILREVEVINLEDSNDGNEEKAGNGQRATVSIQLDAEPIPQVSSSSTSSPVLGRKLESVSNVDDSLGIYAIDLQFIDELNVVRDHAAITTEEGGRGGGGGGGGGDDDASTYDSSADVAAAIGAQTGHRTIVAEASDDDDVVAAAVAAVVERELREIDASLSQNTAARSFRALLDLPADVLNRQEGNSAVLTLRRILYKCCEERDNAVRMMLQREWHCHWDRRYVYSSLSYWSARSVDTPDAVRIEFPRLWCTDTSDPEHERLKSFWLRTVSTYNFVKFILPTFIELDCYRMFTQPLSLFDMGCFRAFRRQFNDLTVSMISVIFQYMRDICALNTLDRDSYIALQSCVQVAYRNAMAKGSILLAAPLSLVVDLRCLITEVAAARYRWVRSATKYPSSDPADYVIVHTLCASLDFALALRGLRFTRPVHEYILCVMGIHHTCTAIPWFLTRHTMHCLRAFYTFSRGDLCPPERLQKPLIRFDDLNTLTLVCAPNNAELDEEIGKFGLTCYQGGSIMTRIADRDSVSDDDDDDDDDDDLCVDTLRKKSTATGGRSKSSSSSISDSDSDGELSASKLKSDRFSDTYYLSEEKYLRFAVRAIIEQCIGEREDVVNVRNVLPYPMRRGRRPLFSRLWASLFQRYGMLSRYEYITPREFHTNAYWSFIDVRNQRFVETAADIYLNYTLLACVCENATFQAKIEGQPPPPSV